MSVRPCRTDPPGPVELGKPQGRDTPSTPGAGTRPQRSLTRTDPRSRGRPGREGVVGYIPRLRSGPRVSTLFSVSPGCRWFGPVFLEGPPQAGRARGAGRATDKPLDTGSPGTGPCSSVYFLRLHPGWGPMGGEVVTGVGGPHPGWGRPGVRWEGRSGQGSATGPVTGG